MFPPEAVAALLPHLDREFILAIYDAAPGSEIRSGKFANPASSAALAANVFGAALGEPSRLTLPGLIKEAEALSIRLEGEARFPWTGGRHPSLDAIISTSSSLIGVEAKRYEPFRPKKKANFSAAFDRDVWAGLEGHNHLRQQLFSGAIRFDRLDATQLIKHALGLSAEAARQDLAPHLVYLFAEPAAWPDGRAILGQALAQHRAEIEAFAAAVRGDGVIFNAMSYAELLTHWRMDTGLAEHASAVLGAFDL